MPNVVRFTLPDARSLHVSGAGQFVAGVLDVDANDLDLVVRTRYLAGPYGAVEIGVVDSATPKPSLPAVPAAPNPDPYPQYPTIDEIVASAEVKAAFGYLASQALTVGQETIPRLLANATAVATGTGSLRLTFFTARKSETVASIRTLSGAQAAAATPTLARIGLYSVAGDGSITLIGSTASDTTLYAGVNTSYTRALTTPVAVTRGNRYAVGILIVTAAVAPTLVGALPVQGPEAGIAPRLAGLVGGQANLPANLASGAITDTAHMSYAVLLP